MKRTGNSARRTAPNYIEPQRWRLAPSGRGREPTSKSKQHRGTASDGLSESDQFEAFAGSLQGQANRVERGNVTGGAREPSLPGGPNEYATATKPARRPSHR